MNYAEIRAIIQEVFDDINQIGYYFQYPTYGEEEIIKELTEKLGEHENVHNDGFYDGYDCQSVLYFKDHDVYIQADGFYTSYNGTEWDRINEVFPYQKTITCYSLKKEEKGE